ncbi:carbon storage regulator CsrA [Paenibacillus sp.]|uniref:carbon storage regulator CsrA n=1 Tax=Paenibacillus sp. TaxID=58172 RepID=UPI002D4AFA2A|nr:carbon storage regulator CsrA [Paenibacillus sp.]HZG87391.1 carbon storage regulator CsrA [Paenibacillus sp.]
MLVLSRKKGESIVIDGNIEITVLGVEGDTVKIGINAPKSIDIFRKEVFDMIQQSNREASLTVRPEDLDELFGGKK